MKKRLSTNLVVSLAVGVVVFSSSAAIAKKLTVTTDADSGSGSLRDAIVQANGDATIDSIKIKNGIGTIVIESALEYTGDQDLSLDGNGTAIQASGGFADDGLVISSAGADLRFSRLTVDGNLKVANGIYVPIPAGQGGTVTVSLQDVSIINSGLFGLHIADQINNSDASINLSVSNSQIENNGVGDLDFDGVRVDEGGIGDIWARITSSSIDGNGGDGLELDERGDGDVDLRVVGSSFNDNGFYNVADLDDGLDVDEAGPGGIIATFGNSSFSNNLDEGLDLDEEDEGSIDVNISNIDADGNKDEGVKVSEEGAGGLTVDLSNATAIDGGDDGIQLEEEDGGSLEVFVVNLTAIDNSKFGLKIEQDTVGDDTGILNLNNSTLEPNGDGALDLDGVVLK